jgi:hypothetical protein
MVGVNRVSWRVAARAQGSAATRLQGRRHDASRAAVDSCRPGRTEHDLGPFQGPRWTGNQPLGRHVSLRGITRAHWGPRIAVACGGTSG